MNKKGQAGIITMAIGAILLVVILSVIFSTLSDQTISTTIADDPFTGINETCVRITPDCYQTGSLAIVNGSNNVAMLGNFTECGDSSIRLNGAFGNFLTCGAVGSTCTATNAWNLS